MSNEQKYIQPEDSIEQNAPVSTNEINDLEVAKKRIHDLILQQHTILDQKSVLQKRNEDLENKVFLAQCFVVKQGLAREYNQLYNDAIDAIDWKAAWEQKYTYEYDEQLKVKSEASCAMWADKALLDMFKSFDKYYSYAELDGIEHINDLLTSRLNDLLENSEEEAKLKYVLPEIDAVANIISLITQASSSYRIIERWKDETHKASIFYKPKESK